MSIDPNFVEVMDCAELERSADAYLDGEFDDRERAEADAHLAVCPRCRERVGRHAHARAALRATLRRAMGGDAPAGRAPDAVRARILAALAQERRPLWRRAAAPVPLAAVAAAAAGVLVVLASHGGADALVDDAVRRHNSDPPLEVVAASVGPEAVLSWFEGKLDFRPVPPRLGGGARLLGGRLSHVREWPAAYIRYALPRGQAGLFIVDDPHGRFAPSGREVHVGPQIVRIVTAHGYNVAVWRHDEIVYSLVSDLDETALFQLVRAAER